MLQRGRPPKGPKSGGGQLPLRHGGASTRSAPEGAEELGADTGRDPCPVASTRSAPEGAEELRASRPLAPAVRFNAVGPRRGRRAPSSSRLAWRSLRFNAVGPRRGRRAPRACATRRRPRLQRGRPPKGPKRDQPPTGDTGAGTASTRSAPEGAEEGCSAHKARPTIRASTRSAPEGAEESPMRALSTGLAMLQRGRPPKGPKRGGTTRARRGSGCFNAVGPRRGRRADHGRSPGGLRPASTRSAPEGAEESGSVSWSLPSSKLQRGRPPKGPKR